MTDRSRYLVTDPAGEARTYPWGYVPRPGEVIFPVGSVISIVYPDRPARLISPNTPEARVIMRASLNEAVRAFYALIEKKPLAASPPALALE